MKLSFRQIHVKIETLLVQSECLFLFISLAGTEDQLSLCRSVLPGAPFMVFVVFVTTLPIAEFIPLLPASGKRRVGEAVLCLTIMLSASSGMKAMCCLLLLQVASVVI